MLNHLVNCKNCLVYADTLMLNKSLVHVWNSHVRSHIAMAVFFSKPHGYLIEQPIVPSSNEVSGIVENLKVYRLICLLYHLAKITAIQSFFNVIVDHSLLRLVH